jgi:hypothetical protein
MVEGRHYVYTFPCIRITHRNTFCRTDRRVRKIETYFRGIRRQTRTIRTAELQDRMDNRWTSWDQQLQNTFVLSKILKIICKQCQFLYHLNRVQDISFKLRFKGGFVSADSCHNVPLTIFLSVTLFVVEAGPTHDGITNFNNLCSLADFNPYVTTPLRICFSVTSP